MIKIEHLDKSVKDDSPEVMAQQDMRKADYYVSTYHSFEYYFNFCGYENTIHYSGIP